MNSIDGIVFERMKNFEKRVQLLERENRQMKLSLKLLKSRGHVSDKKTSTRNVSVSIATESGASEEYQMPEINRIFPSEGMLTNKLAHIYDLRF